MSKFFLKFLLGIAILNGISSSYACEQLVPEEQYMSLIPRELQILLIPEDIPTRLNLRLVNKDFNQDIQSLWTAEKVVLNLTSKNALEEYLNLQSAYKLPHVFFKLNFSLTAKQMEIFNKNFPQNKIITLYPTEDFVKITIDSSLLKNLITHNVDLMDNYYLDDNILESFNKEFSKTLERCRHSYFLLGNKELSSSMSDKTHNFLKILDYVLKGEKSTQAYSFHIYNQDYINHKKVINKFRDEYENLSTDLEKELMIGQNQEFLDFYQNLPSPPSLAFEIYYDIKPNLKKALNIIYNILIDIKDEEIKENILTNFGYELCTLKAEKEHLEYHSGENNKARNKSNFEAIHKFLIKNFSQAQTQNSKEVLLAILTKTLGILDNSFEIDMESTHHLIDSLISFDQTETSSEMILRIFSSVSEYSFLKNKKMEQIYHFLGQLIPLAQTEASQEMILNISCSLLKNFKNHSQINLEQAYQFLNKIIPLAKTQDAQEIILKNFSCVSKYSFLKNKEMEQIYHFLDQLIPLAQTETSSEMILNISCSLLKDFKNHSQINLEQAHQFLDKIIPLAKTQTAQEMILINFIDTIYDLAISKKINIGVEDFDSSIEKIAPLINNLRESRNIECMLLWMYDDIKSRSK